MDGGHHDNSAVCTDFIVVIRNLAESDDSAEEAGRVNRWNSLNSSRLWCLGSRNHRCEQAPKQRSSTATDTLTLREYLRFCSLLWGSGGTAGRNRQLSGSDLPFALTVRFAYTGTHVGAVV